MLSVNPTGSHCVFTIGDHVFEVPTASARALGKFLDENSAAGIWENADPVIVADWRFEAARDARWQKPSDIGRGRVRVYCPAGRWHFLPEELAEIGAMFRRSLE